PPRRRGASRVRQAVPELQRQLPAVRQVAARGHPPDPPGVHVPHGDRGRRARRDGAAPPGADPMGLGARRDPLRAGPARGAERLARRVRGADRGAPRRRDGTVGRRGRPDPPALPRPGARSRAPPRRRGRGSARLMEAGVRTREQAPARPLVLDYLTLAKPKVQSLLLFTTITTMY